jgi:hypothetical protein
VQSSIFSALSLSLFFPVSRALVLRHAAAIVGAYVAAGTLAAAAVCFAVLQEKAFYYFIFFLYYFLVILFNILLDFLHNYWHQKMTINKPLDTLGSCSCTSPRSR